MSEQPSSSNQIGPHAGHIRPRLREAIRILVMEGTTQRIAAERAGLKEHSLQVALAKPHVKAYRASVVEAHMSGKTPVAWRVVHDLMENAASEDVRHKAARTHLEALGELTEKRERDSAPSQLIQIICTQPMMGPAFEIRPGVVGAPPADWNDGQAEERPQADQSALFVFGGNR